MKKEKEISIFPLVDLAKAMTNEFGENFKFSSFEILMGGTIVGTLKGVLINIYFNINKYLIVSFGNDQKELVDELIPLLTKIMNDFDPICSYELKNLSSTKEETMTTIEWNLSNPEKRLNEIVNGSAFDYNYEIFNLALHGNRVIDNYIEKIPGIYPGNINDVEEVHGMDEVDLYFAIEKMQEYLFWRSNDVKCRSISQAELSEYEYGLEYLVYQTTKFGVELAEPKVGRRVFRTPSYNAWFSFYRTHFNDVLTKNNWGRFIAAKKAGKDISGFIPKGNWKSFLAKNEKTILE